MVNCWIFNVKDDKSDKYSRKGIEIYNHRMAKDKFWGLQERTASGRRTVNIAYLKKGDMVLFYLVGGHSFLGTCVLASSFRKLEKEEAKRLTHEGYLDWNQGVFLKRVDKWDEHLPIECLRGKVSFVPCDGNYGKYLQGSVKKITELDYSTVVCEHNIKLSHDS